MRLDFLEYGSERDLGSEGVSVVHGWFIVDVPNINFNASAAKKKSISISDNTRRTSSLILHQVRVMRAGNKVFLQWLRHVMERFASCRRKGTVVSTGEKQLKVRQTDG